MNERVKALLFCAMALVAAIPASAQVGHDPGKSPYADLEYSQEFTLLGGYLRTRHDPAGILPNSRPMFGVRYEATLTGPLAISADIISAFGDRNVVDPTKPAATRNIGTQSNAVVAADLAAALNLTGTRSWHSLVPQIRGGIGLVRSAAKDDSTGYAFGTPFAFVYGAGVKYVPGGRFQLRADVTDRVFKQNYTDAYYRFASDNTVVVPSTTARSFYTHHTALTLGVSYLFAR
ncbi:MAG: outer membrane beta-barrel protein [bacterium]